MALLINRAASVLVACAYLVAAAASGDGSTAIMVGLYCLLPLACIWFPEAMGSVTSMHGLPLNESPGCMVTVGGWLLLLLPVIVALVSYLRSG